jgi:hypothetical protein
VAPATDFTRGRGGAARQLTRYRPEDRVSGKYSACTARVLAREQRHGRVLREDLQADYGYVNELHDAVSVMRQLASWFEDYNETHPHKGLRMQSPREYRRATANI